MKIDTAWLEEKVFGHKLSADELDALNSLMDADNVAKGGKIVGQGERAHECAQPCLHGAHQVFSRGTGF